MNKIKSKQIVKRVFTKKELKLIVEFLDNPNNQEKILESIRTSIQKTKDK